MRPPLRLRLLRPRLAGPRPGLRRQRAWRLPLRGRLPLLRPRPWPLGSRRLPLPPRLPAPLGSRRLPLPLRLPAPMLAEPGRLRPPAPSRDEPGRLQLLRASCRLSPCRRRPSQRPCRLLCPHQR